MKTIWKKLAAISTAAAMCAGVGLFAACSGGQATAGPQGPQGEAGTAWLTGRGLPTDQQLDGAKEGDFYINLNTNTIYVLGADNTWSLLVNVNESNNVSKWDGTIPGWQAPNLSDEEIIANRPVSYIVNEDTKSVDIYNAEAFAWFAYRSVIGVEGYKGWTVTLHCDIDLDNKMWVPIGLGARSNAAGVAFQGTFDGNGHTIYNLSSAAFYEGIQYGEFTNLLSKEDDQTETGWYVNVKNHYLGYNVDVDVALQLKDNSQDATDKRDEFSFGLFGSAYNATIKNLNMENVTIDLPEKTVNEGEEDEHTCIGDSTGAIVGFAQYNLVMDNCRVGYEGCTGTITGAKCAGGLVGRFYGGKEGAGKDQYDDENVKTYDKAYYGKVTITNCVNYLGVGVSGIDKKAGIIGYPGYFSALTIENCVNYGEIVGIYAGGIIGYRGNGTNPARGSVTISNCVNFGKITGNYAGGIVGQRSTTGGSAGTPFFILRGCVNYGDVLGKNFVGSDNKVASGGLIGGMSVSAAAGLMLDCFNYGNVTADVSDNNLASEAYAGGLIGKFEVTNANTKFVVSGGSCGTATLYSNKTEASTSFAAGICFGLTPAADRLLLPYGSMIEAGTYSVVLASAAE